MPFDGTTYEQDAVLALLRRAREMVARPGGWCQGYFEYGEKVCATGAFPWRVRTRDSGAIYELFLSLPCWWRILRRSPKWLVISIFNDVPWRRQKRIVALFDRAIENREKANAR